MSGLRRMRDAHEVAQSNRLWTLRRRQGLTREALRKRLAADPEDPVVYASPQSIASIEKGQQSFPRDHAPTFARALDVPLDVLMGWRPGASATVSLAPYGTPPKPPEPDADAVRALARKLSWESQTPEQRGAWVALARTRLRDASTHSDQ